ncbi:hypothetical protein [Halostella salina]|uniref:hypothetical protein n=1 Tax=Halostella salina TaxID=1547897 RepID=UPI000EF77AF8|nr:hypothetical protein [Halostella salina]
MDDAERDRRLAALHDALAATAELPVERNAARWIGEAEAVAADLAESDLPVSTVEERVGHVRDLLAEVDGSGHPEADDRIQRARELADRILA